MTKDREIFQKLTFTQEISKTKNNRCFVKEESTFPVFARLFYTKKLLIKIKVRKNLKTRKI